MMTPAKEGMPMRVVCVKLSKMEAVGKSLGFCL